MNKYIDKMINIRELSGVGPKKAEAYERLNINNLDELIHHLPREYEDLRNKKSIMSLCDEEKALVQARVLMINKGKGYGRKRTLRLLTEDNTGRMEVLFFMGGYMERAFTQGNEYIFYGKVKNESGRITMFHPTFSLADESAQTGIIPVYPLTKGLTQRELRKHISFAINYLGDIEESLPKSIIQKKNLCGLTYALSNIHFPKDERTFREARYRLIYEELFDLQVALILSRERFGNGRHGIQFSKKVECREYTSNLSYKLTDAQDRVINDVENDMESERAMNRLVQ